jgi:hypothetical protein
MAAELGIQEWDMGRLSIGGRLKVETYLEALQAARRQAQQGR